MSDPGAGGAAPRRRVIAIDGPAASGKSTTAAAVGKALGFVHLNSGLLYRAYTWSTIRRGWVESDPGYDDAVASVAIDLARDESDLRLLVDGEDPGLALHGREVAARVSAVASIRSVRAAVFERLQSAAGEFDIVCDGRDIGTTVFPDADLKVFLVADAGERARRRLLEHGETTDLDRIREEAERLRRRDEADATRELSPLRKADDAVEIDTTEMSAEEVVELILSLAEECGMERISRD